MIPLVSWLPLTRRAALLRERLEQPGQGDRVRADVADDQRRAIAQLQAVQLEQRGEGGDGERDDDLGARGAQRGDLWPDVDVGVDVALLGRDHRGRDLVVQALDPVLAELVVLVEERHLLAREVLLHVLPEDLALAHVVDLPAERLRLCRGHVPALAAGCDEHVGDLLGVQEVHHGQVRRRAEAVEDRVHVVLQHQLPHDRRRGGRVVGIVEVLVDDLAAVDAAVRVDVVEVGGRRGGDLAVAGGGGPGERLVAADGDRGRGDAGRGRGQGRA